MKMSKEQLEHQWAEVFQGLSDSQIVLMETFIIKNFIKENIEKLTNENNFNLSKSMSKKITSKGSLVQVNSKVVQSKQTIPKIKHNLQFLEEILLGVY